MKFATVTQDGIAYFDSIQELTDRHEPLDLADADDFVVCDDGTIFRLVVAQAKRRPDGIVSAFLRKILLVPDDMDVVATEKMDWDESALKTLSEVIGRYRGHPVGFRLSTAEQAVQSLFPPP